MFYVYEWYNTSTNEIFYVGKGCRNRYKVISQRNWLFKDYYNSHPCASRIIAYYDLEAEALQAEHERIIELKKQGQCTCNLDNGGAGGLNFVWTEEMRDYKSQNNPMKDPTQKERMSKFNPMRNPDVAKKVGAAHQKVVIYQGKETTCAKIAEETGYVIETIWKWCQRGYDVNGKPCFYLGGAPKEKKNTSSKKVQIDDQIFPSLRAAADFLGVKDTSPLCKALKANKTYKGHKCSYVNQQPSDTNSDKSSIEGPETNG